MLSNYFTIAIRSIRRNLSYTFLNVFGLTLSVAACLVIFLVVRNELSYDSYHKKADRTYRVTLHALDFNPSVSMAVVPAMRTDFPELEAVSQAFFQTNGLVKAGNTSYIEKRYGFVDEQFTSIFDFEWLAGNPKSALQEPNTAVLTESIARKFFGDKDAMGQIFRLNNEFDVKVTGLIKDLPGNTHLPIQFMVSFATIRQDLQSHGAMSEFYAIMGGNAYIVLPPHYSALQLEKKIPAFIKKNWGQDIAKEASLLLQPMKDIHFDQRYLNNSNSPTTSRKIYWGLAIIALFIMVTACINFINLATAQSMRRAKEVGVRKVLGANRPQLIWQFLSETSFLVFVALLLGVVSAFLFIPQVATWLDVKISNRQLLQPVVLGLVVSLGILIMLLAGLYPAFVQSSFRPVESLKRTTGHVYHGLSLRKGLVFIQFAISQILIVGTLVVAKQMDFLKAGDLGFDKEAVVTFNLPQKINQEVLKQQLIDDPGVAMVSFSSGAPSYNSSFTTLQAPEFGVTKDDVTEMKFIDEQYTSMFGLKMLAGRAVAKLGKNDTIPNIVVNETLIHKFGMRQPEDAVGKRVIVGGRSSVIMGVVQDFQSESKHKLRRPCVLLYNPNVFFAASVRLRPQEMQKTMAHIQKMWTALFPDDVFQYEFLDDHIASLYKQEAKVYTAFRLFSSLAILIGCLGLYGLVAFSAVQRTREVGIRKVLGASLVDIVGLFAKEFILLIILAFFIAAPVAYLVMNYWLGNFAYHINIGGGMFLAGIGISFLIAAFTIAYQSLKAALANPLKSLQTE
ncbi:ABC transporter permease [Chitinophaga sp. MM2321]|uniref:ABC transporter permease n=1 Tax=Chitinophaga sp. MM2321 TaxID=3137178 RepID=UPI0032D591AA